MTPMRSFVYLLDTEERAHTGQKLEQFDVFVFRKTENSGNTQLGPTVSTVRPRQPGSTQDVTKMKCLK